MKLIVEELLDKNNDESFRSQPLRYRVILETTAHTP